MIKESMRKRIGEQIRRLLYISPEISKLFFSKGTESKKLGIYYDSNCSKN